MSVSANAASAPERSAAGASSRAESESARPSSRPAASISVSRVGSGIERVTARSSKRVSPARAAQDEEPVGDDQSVDGDAGERAALRLRRIAPVVRRGADAAYDTDHRALEHDLGEPDVARQERRQRQAEGGALDVGRQRVVRIGRALDAQGAPL